MDKIYLYPATKDDFEDYYKVRSDPTDVYWNGFTSPPEKESFRLSFYKRTADAPFEKPEDRRNYLIKKTDTDETVGFLQLIRREDCVEMGNSVSMPFQGNGYATESLRKGIYLAREFNLPIVVHVRDDNIPSKKQVLKNGFVPTEEYIEKEYPKAGIVKLRKYVLESVNLTSVQ